MPGIFTLRSVPVLPVAAAVVSAAFIMAPAGNAQTAGRTQPASAATSSRPNAPSTLAATGATLTKYCVTCHNARLKTAGFVLDPADLSRVPEHAEQWEKVVRKLRTNAMPPAGAPRPDEATYNSTASFLEAELDRDASARPNPGKLPSLHRLTRTEYQNAIRDLLALDALPKEIDYSLLLPPDNSSSGFDNIADLLFVSPTAMERYLDAARKISRLAVGDPTAPVLVNTYRISPELPQDERVGELPFGTRGGLAVRSDFPADGDYVIKFEVSGATPEQQQVEISVDGERVKLLPFVGKSSVVQMAGRDTANNGNNAPDSKTAEIRVPIKAGPRLVGVTFIQRTEARDESTLRPRMRSRGTFPSIASVTISGPYDVKGSGDTPSRQRIFVCSPASAADEMPCAKRILSTLERRAFRRPVTDADLRDLMPFYTAGRSDVGQSEAGGAHAGFERGIQKALERMLVSPQFLFRIERDPAGIAPGTAYRVGDVELASRLSFFIWSSLPDEELLDIAAKGKLKEPVVLEQQVKRMLADPRSESLVTNFAAQWLFLRDLDAKQPDELLFPDFDENLRAAFRHETDLFLDSVLRGNRSVLDLLTANYSFVNERLARHYGIPNVEGSYFRRVTFPEGSVRGGLLGQGSLLTITSYATRTSPVVRGKWVLENLLNSAPPPPPPNVPALKTDAGDSGRTLSMREAMVQHRANPACAGCHARMDPIGFAMENFDAVGKWRDKDSGNRIDASGVFPDGTKFDGMAGLKQALLAHPEQFVTTVTEKLLMYGIGRNLQYYDAPAVRAIVREGARSRYTFASLVLGVVKSAPFQMRESQSEPSKASAATASVQKPRAGSGERRSQ
jgi:mono/diheme cytochrome c family protein